MAVAAQQSKARRCGSALVNPTQNNLAKNLYTSEVLTKTCACSQLEWDKADNDVRW
jgi:hypothetical protein